MSDRRCLVTKNQCGTDTWGSRDGCPCSECQAYLAEKPATFDDTLVGTLGFFIDSGLSAALGIKRLCTDHGGAEVEAVLWSNDGRGWCANHNPFTVRMPKKENA